MTMKKIVGRFYEVTAKYEGVDESGAPKKVTEQYIVCAVNFTDAENQTMSALSGYKDVEIKNINPVNYTELYIPEDADDCEVGLFFKIKVALENTDEKTGKPKRTTSVSILQAENFAEAFENTRKIMAGVMCDWSAVNIQETKIQGVIQPA